MADKDCESCSVEGCDGKGKSEAECREARLKERMSRIRHVFVVLSGKGGVGKSTVAVNLAAGLALAGRKVGLLDADIHGPSVPRMLGVEGAQVESDGACLRPVACGNGMKVMSIGFMLRTPDDAVIWRGPLKMGELRQFLSDVDWGELDYLIVDQPPGTGDEPLSICQLIPGADGGIIVTTPQQVAVIDVRKCIDFCRKLEVPVTGVVENMSGFVCPHCGRQSDIFGRGGGEEMAADMGVPFLGRIPLDPRIMQSCEGEGPYAETARNAESAAAFVAIADAVLRAEAPGPGSRAIERDTNGSMEHEGRRSSV